MRSTLNRFSQHLLIRIPFVQIVKNLSIYGFPSAVSVYVCVCVSVTVKFSIFTTFLKPYIRVVKYRANEWEKDRRKKNTIVERGVLQWNLPVRLQRRHLFFNSLLLHLYHHAVIILYINIFAIVFIYNISHGTSFYFDFVCSVLFYYCNLLNRATLSSI